MPDQISTAAELDTLQAGSVFEELNGHCVWRTYAPGEHQAGGHGRPMPSERVASDFGPFALLYRPDVPPVIPGQNLGKPAAELDRARAVLALIPPQRCAPSEDEVAQTVLAHTPTSWRSFANDSLLLRCCGRDYGTPVRNLKRGEDGGAHAGYAAHLAAVVAKLYGDQPTVAQAKAEALREEATELDRDAAEGRVARRVAGVRCLRCDLRHEEREEYSCQIEGTAHDYDEAELAEAARPDSETSWISDRLRARAAAIESGAEHG